MGDLSRYNFKDFPHPPQTKKDGDTLKLSDKDIEESTLLKSFNDRILGLLEAARFFQDINFLSFKEDYSPEVCYPIAKSQPSYSGSDESNCAKLLINMFSKSYFGGAKYIITDNTGIAFGQLLIKNFSKANQKIIIKSPHGNQIGSILFVYEGYTSNDEFHILNSREEIIMSMKPEHVGLHNFEFPVKDVNNSYIANIIHKGNVTTLQMSSHLVPKLKLLLIPLVILLMKIKAKLRKKRNL